MSPVSRGFRGRGRIPAEEEDRVPPGQYVTKDFPVLSAGPTPHTPLPEWTFSITQGSDTLKSWTWQEMQALPAETVTTDIHCVTRWSKVGAQWRGVPVDTLLDQVAADAPYVLAFCDGGYTTNLPPRTSPAARRGWPSVTTARRSNPSTAARPGCSCRTCTSGRAPSGCAAWNCAITTRPGLGDLRLHGRTARGVHVHGDAGPGARVDGHAGPGVDVDGHAGRLTARRFAYQTDMAQRGIHGLGSKPEISEPRRPSWHRY